MGPSGEGCASKTYYFDVGIFDVIVGLGQRSFMYNAVRRLKLDPAMPHRE